MRRVHYVRLKNRGLILEVYEINWIAIAAWVQAIGSIIAIGIAIWVPFKLAKESRYRQEINEAFLSKVVQISLLPKLYRLRSSTKDFLDLESGENSFLDVQRKPDDFDHDFFSLVPELADTLSFASKSGVIQEQLMEIAIVLFKTNELLAEITRLQRDGYHAAWVNNKEFFLEAAENISKLSDNFISNIESIY